MLQNFEKLVRDLNLIDMQDDDELCTATSFCLNWFIVIYYQDHEYNLDDIYFVDRH